MYLLDWELHVNFMCKRWNCNEADKSIVLHKMMDKGKKDRVGTRVPDTILPYNRVHRRLSIEQLSFPTLAEWYLSRLDRSSNDYLGKSCFLTVSLYSILILVSTMYRAGVTLTRIGESK